MKKQFILFVLFLFSINYLSAQIEEEDIPVIKSSTDINITLDIKSDSMEDSVQQKLNIILHDINLTGRIMEAIVHESTYLLQKNIDNREGNISFTPQVFEECLTEITQSEDLQIFINDIINYYSNNFSLAELESLAEFYNTPLGNKSLQAGWYSGVVLNQTLISWDNLIKEYLDKVDPPKSGKSKKKKKKKKVDNQKI